MQSDEHRPAALGSAKGNEPVFCRRMSGIRREPGISGQDMLDLGNGNAAVDPQSPSSARAPVSRNGLGSRLCWP
jgi:hypothetical protein